MDQIRIDLGNLVADERVAGMRMELEAGADGAEGASWTGEFAAVGKVGCQIDGGRRSVPFGASWTSEFAAVGKVTCVAQGARWTREFAAVGKATGKAAAPLARRTIPFSGAI